MAKASKPKTKNPVKATDKPRKRKGKKSIADNPGNEDEGTEPQQAWERGESIECAPDESETL